MARQARMGTRFALAPRATPVCGIAAGSPDTRSPPLAARLRMGTFEPSTLNRFLPTNTLDPNPEEPKTSNPNLNPNSPNPCG